MKRRYYAIDEYGQRHSISYLQYLWLRWFG